MTEAIDIEEERRLAASYVAETKGPYVDELRPMTELAQKYEGAHQTFQKKIENLASNFPLWRCLKGDGSCGFRALLFGFFENVLSHGDAQFLEHVGSRLSKKWSDLGIDELYEDWLEEFRVLISRLCGILHSKGDVMVALTAEFNLEENQRNYIQFLRTLTAAWMRTNRELYEAALDEDLNTWCHSHVEMPDAEIEHIHHMDLSPGAEANIHTLSSDEIAEHDTQQKSPGPIWLLYRPGHYDLVYAAE